MSENKINIPFSGITRNTDDGTCKDGECMELINARVKNGSIEPIGNPILLKEFGEEYKKGYYHPLAKKYLFIKESDGSIVSYDLNFENKEPLSNEAYNVMDLRFIGNTMCAITESGIKYFINSSGTYRYLGENPQMPKIEIGSIGTVYSEVTTEKINGRRDSAHSIFSAKIKYSTQVKAVGRAKADGNLVGTTLCRYALRMFDGSYIMYSPIYVIKAPDKTYKIDYGATSSRPHGYDINLSAGQNSFIESLGKDDFDDSSVMHTDPQIYEYAILSFAPTVDIIESKLEAWSGIILSIDVFLSDDIPDYFVKKISPESGDVYEVYSYDPEEYKKKIISTPVFYKFAEIPLDKAGKNGTVKYNDLTDLLNCDELPVDSFSRSIEMPKVSYVYNSRLHIANIRTRLFEGYNLSEFMDTTKETYTIIGRMRTYIDTNTGKSIVETALNFKAASLNLSQYIMYPDTRAEKILISIVVYNSTDATNKPYSKRINLTPSNSVNASYYFDMLSVATDRSTRPTYIKETGKGITIDNLPDESFDETPLNEYDLSPSKLKVSELNNPFNFPARTTYTPSSSEILALHSNTVAISQGQFGQHPLIVFCRDGIYAMAVGTDVVYTNSAPLNRNVCNNPSGVTPIDNAIVFPTEQGIILLRGSAIQNLSELINGYLPSCVESSPVISKILNIPKLSGSASVVKFDEYIKDCAIGYNYQEQELVVSNKKYNYSYLYSLTFGQWYKTSYSVKSFINSYPDILALTTSSNNICNLQNSRRTIADIAIISRPVKLGTLTYKRILQSAIRGMVKRSISNLYLKGEPVMFRDDSLLIFKDVGFYVLGSNDTEHFTLISGTEAIKDIRDIVGKMTKSKAYKYFMFAFVGGVRTDISINYIELIADESFTNRLR